MRRAIYKTEENMWCSLSCVRRRSNAKRRLFARRAPGMRRGGLIRTADPCNATPAPRPRCRSLGLCIRTAPSAARVRRLGSYVEGFIMVLADVCLTAARRRWRKAKGSPESPSLAQVLSCAPKQVTSRPAAKPSLACAPRSTEAYMASACTVSAGHHGARTTRAIRSGRSHRSSRRRTAC